MKKWNIRKIFSVCIKITFLLLASLSVRQIISRKINIQNEYLETIYSQNQNYPKNNYIYNDQGIIDYSNTDYGYIIIKCIKDTNNKIKVTVKSQKNEYIYSIPKNEWVSIPLTEGNGSYTINIYENVIESKYALILTGTFNIKLLNENYPFLNSNLYVNFNNSSKIVEQAKDLTKNAKTDYEKIQKIYNFIINNISYDYEKAQNVKSGYTPKLDEILETKKGICFDYAALMCGMLRSQNIPCKLVVGYVGNTYHAWISVYVKKQDESIGGMTYYDKPNWLHMDPTYATNKSKEVIEYINNGKNYTEKYCY